MTSPSAEHRGVRVAVDAMGGDHGPSEVIPGALDFARAHPTDTVILVGDEPYYARVGFAKLPPGRIVFPGPVDRARVLGLSLKPDALAGLSGDVRRARIDDPVCADGAALG